MMFPVSESAFPMMSVLQAWAVPAAAKSAAAAMIDCLKMVFMASFLLMIGRAARAQRREAVGGG